MRQWVLSIPFPLRFLFASQPTVMGKALGIIYRTIATHLTHKTGFTKRLAQTGAVTLIQRFGGVRSISTSISICCSWTVSILNPGKGTIQAFVGQSLPPVMNSPN
jgi:hypothetical protein